MAECDCPAGVARQPLSVAESFGIRAWAIVIAGAFAVTTSCSLGQALVAPLLRVTNGTVPMSKASTPTVAG